MTETFPGPAAFGDSLPEEVMEEGRRAHALELAVELHAGRARAGSVAPVPEIRDQAVVDTAKRFDAYLRDGE